MKIKIVKFLIAVGLILLAFVNINIAVSDGNNFKLIQDAKAVKDTRCTVCYFCFDEGQVAYSCPLDPMDDCFTTICLYGVCDSY